MFCMNADNILKLIYNAHLFLSELESVPRDYGTGDILYSSDIHTVAALGKNIGCSLTELAVSMEVSKAAASKFVKKLQRLNYVRKEDSPTHGKKVLFFLTVKGNNAVKAHQEFEKIAFDPLKTAVDSFSEDDRNIVYSFLSKLNNIIETDTMKDIIYNYKTGH